jgi:outer membrane protein assembly factor BamB
MGKGEDLKTKVNFVSSILLLLILLTDQTPCLTSATQQPFHQTTIINVTFKILAVESNLNGTPLKNAQHLIKNLRSFKNWQNYTSADFQYTAYIHLLSDTNYEEIDPECQQYYIGNATRNNVIDAIVSFLNVPENNRTISILVFYYVGKSEREVVDGKTSFYMALDKPLFDWEIDEFLPSDELQKSTLVILDTPYSGGYISKLQNEGRVILTACNPFEEIVTGLFTGHENASYPDGTHYGPLGIIGAIHTAEDINKDGWLSTDEVFRFAWKTLVNFSSNQLIPSYPHPWACYGVAGGALSFVQRDQTKPCPGFAKHCIPVMFLPNSSRYDWSLMECSTYRYSITRTGYSQSKGVKNPDLLWEICLNSSIVSSPVVASGILYVTTWNGKVYALDLKTGREIWMFDTNCSISSTPSVDKGLIIFGTEKPGKIYSLDAYTGIVRWFYRIPNGDVVKCSPAIVEEKVIIGSSDGYLRCFNQFDGELLWASYIGGKPSSPAIVNQTIFVTCPHVYAVDIFTGALLWKYPTNWPVFSSPAVDDELVFVGAENDDRIFALEQKTGRLVWSFQTGGWLTSPAVDSFKKLVVAGCRDARTYCLNEFTGFLKWQFINAPNHLSAPTISEDGLVYFGSTDGYVYCLNEETGQEIWKYYVASQILSSPIIAYQHLIVTSENGKLFCFGPPFPEHNIAVLYASASPLKIREGDKLKVNFTVENHGNVEENVTVTINLNCFNNGTDQTVRFEINFTLLPLQNNTLGLEVNSTNMPPGLCRLLIEAQLAPDEVDASDNTYLTAIIVLALVDIDANGEINIVDITRAALAYNSRPGDPNWNSDADINKDNIINIIDITLIAKEFGKIYSYRT